jgi:hypothetical protein
MKAVGRKENNMEKVYTLIQKEYLKLEFGSWEFFKKHLTRTSI